MSAGVPTPEVRKQTSRDVVRTIGHESAKGYDLMLVGASESRRGIRGEKLEKLVTEAPCHVAIVKNRASNGNFGRRVLVPIDGSFFSRVAVEFAIRYAEGAGEGSEVTMVLVTDRNAALLFGDYEGAVPARLPGLAEAMNGHEAAAFWPHPHGLMEVVTVPIALGRDAPDILGTLSVGFLLDDQRAEQFKRATGSDIAFAADGRIRGATLPEAVRGALAALTDAKEACPPPIVPGGLGTAERRPAPGRPAARKRPNVRAAGEGAAAREGGSYANELSRRRHPRRNRDEASSSSRAAWRFSARARPAARREVPSRLLCRKRRHCTRARGRGCA